MKAEITIHIKGDKKAIQKFYQHLINDPVYINRQTYIDTSDYRPGGYNEVNAIVTRTNIGEVK